MNSRSEELQLWLGILIPPIAWAIQMQVNYSLVGFQCYGGGRISMFITSVVGFTLGAIGGAIAFLNWRRRGRVWPDDSTGDARALFMAALGLALSGMFCLVIAAQAIAVVVLHPCLL